MIAELGLYSLLVAFVASFLGSLPLLLPSMTVQPVWQKTVRIGGWLTGGFILASFLLLIACFVNDDFSVALVFQHSHSLQPLLYKVSGVWGNHEGSLLLWLLVLALCGAALEFLPNELTQEQKTRMCVVINGILFVFLTLSIFTSNPFARLVPVPLDGADLNPLLQDPGLAFHPPMLYIGYVGMALVFAAACAVLWEGKFTPAWARMMRICMLGAWSVLTAGLALGSWWAYYELGWGGWWFWDPVENAALMPWLIGAALLHVIRVVEVKGIMARWALLLAIIAFALSLLGTFLVRSGILTSVHAFASDPLRGMAILGIFFGLTGVAFALLAWRWPLLAPTTAIKPISREGMLLLNNIFLSVAAATVLIGTLYPLLIDALGREAITVGPPYFNATFVPLMLPLFVVLALGQPLPWGMAQNVSRTIWPIIMAMVIVMAAYIYVIKNINILPLAAFAAGFIVVTSSAAGFRRMGGGQLLSHIGLGIAVMGMAGSALGIERMIVLHPNERITFAGYHIQYERPFQAAGPNYLAGGAIFDVRGSDNDYITRMAAERRYYPVADRWTTEAAIYTTLLGDLFITVGAPDESAAVSARMRYSPLQNWLWIGAALMMLGGIVGGVRAMRQR